MNKHALTVLEFHNLLVIIADYARTEPGRNQILALRPFRNPDKIKLPHRLYRDILNMFEADLPLPIAPFDDVTEILHTLEPANSVVGGPELLACRSALSMASHCHETLGEAAYTPFTELQKERNRLHIPRNLLHALNNALDDDGDLLDNASPQLSNLRKQIRQVKGDLTRRAERILASQAYESVLMNQFYTIRNNRYVIPVKRDVKNQVKGILHDHSDSGRTAFIEPESLVGLGNDLADLRLEENAERRRIFARLSEKVREQIEAFTWNHRTLSRLDRAYGVCCWARDYECILPTFGPSLDLREIRHPILEHQFRQTKTNETTVPIDVILPQNTSALAITGSNSGGKTAALKTLGLISVAARAGLPIPAAPQSQLELFDTVFADIGDEQSLQQNLSTFTGHLTNIRETLNAISGGQPESGKRRHRSLVLLDELGSGTDPIEGGALACAILQQLAQHDALAIITTHLGAVKDFVESQDNMLNGHVRFNVETLQPEYIVNIGQPGASHALAIARRVGLPESITATAETLIDRDHIEMEKALADIEEHRRKISVQESESQQAMNQARKEREELKAELTELRKERKQLMRKAYEQADATVDNTRKEMENLIRRIREAQNEAEMKKAACQAREKLKQREQKVKRGLEQTKPATPRKINPDQLSMGDRVWVDKLKDHGSVINISHDRKKATIEVNNMRAEMKTSALSAPQNAEPQSAPQRISVSRPKMSGSVPSELNLIGMTVDEALPKLENYLARATMSNLPEIRIIHGIGTGRLKQAVHETLRNHPEIVEYHLGGEKDPGGAGATLITLKEL